MPHWPSRSPSGSWCRAPRFASAQGRAWPRGAAPLPRGRGAPRAPGTRGPGGRRGRPRKRGPVDDLVRHPPQRHARLGRERGPHGHLVHSGGDPGRVGVRESLRRQEIGALRQGEHHLAGGRGHAQRDAASCRTTPQGDAETAIPVTDVEVFGFGERATEERDRHGDELGSRSPLLSAPPVVARQPFVAGSRFLKPAPPPYGA